MTRIHGWKARRSGGGMTIEGRADDGRKIKLTDVETIDGSGPLPVARVRGGNDAFELAAHG